MYQYYAQLRDERGISDYEVAQKAGISQSTLYDWKAGRYQPKIDKLMRIASFLGVSVTALLPDEVTANEGPNT